MADFVQPPDPNDPDAIKKALLAKLLGGPIPGAVPPPGATQRSLTGTPDPGTPPLPGSPATMQPNASSQPATPIAAAPGPQPAKPLASATPIQPGPQPAQPFPSETDWAKQNPAAPHTPYQAPDFKHRLLEGIFAGLQEFGRPGEGAATIRNYLGNIQKNQDAESNYPATAAAQQHQQYMTAAQGAKAPLDLEDLKAQIADRQATARKTNADAIAAGQPKQDKNLAQMHVEAVQDAIARGVDPATDPKVKQVEDSIQRIQKEPAGAKAPNAKEGIQQQLAAEMAKPQPDHKVISGLQNQLRQLEPLAEDRMKDAESRAAKAEKPSDKRSAAESAQVERETRVAVRKADSDYRNARATADMQREFINEAKGGNKAAVKIVPLEGALEITTSQGVHRINKTEVEQYGGAGSLYDRIAGAIGKGVSGKDIPDNVLNDMDKMTQAVIENAHKKYSDTYDDETDIAKGYGLDLKSKIPKLSKEGHTGGGNAGSVTSGNTGAAGALPPGWK